MSSTTAPPVAAASRLAVTEPGLRWCGGVIALYRWVTVGRSVKPSKPADASSSRASRSAVSSLIRDRATTCRPRKYTPPSRTYAAPDSASAPASRITAST